MRTETKSRILYKFDELPDDAKEKAIQNLSDINCNYEWWDCIYEAAKNIGLEITSFDLDRNRHAKGKFTTSAPEAAETIIKEHGAACETYKTAQAYMSAVNLDPPIEDSEYDAWDEAKTEQDNEFLYALLEDYSIMLQKESEYKQSPEAIIETIQCNDYEFDAEGKLA